VVWGLEERNLRLPDLDEAAIAEKHHEDFDDFI
jgi:hypothetical protein